MARTLALTLALTAALAVSAAPALAHGGKGGGVAGKDTLLTAAATYIGVTPAEITAAKQAGQTLAQLATSKGKTAEGLAAALVAAGNSAIDAAQAAGTITAAQATARKAGLAAEVTAFVNSTRAGCSGKGTKAGSGSKSGFKSRR